MDAARFHLGEMGEQLRENLVASADEPTRARQKLLIRQLPQPASLVLRERRDLVADES